MSDRPIANLDEVEFDDVEENGRYTSRRARFSRSIGARDLGYNLTVLPPGKAQCPFHNHRGEEGCSWSLKEPERCASGSANTRSARAT